DRDEPGVSGQQVPHLGEPEQCDELDEDPHPARVAPAGAADQHDDSERRADETHPARAGGALDPETARGLRRAQAILRAFAKSPWGRKSRTARKTRWPVRMPHPGDSFAPTVWATPSTAPPTRVPQS